MLWTIVVILFILWFLSFLVKAADGMIHLILLAASGVALIVILLSDQFILS